MNASTYLDWSSYHAKAFGLRTEHDLEMLAVWANAFEQARFTVAELFEATNWMLTEKAPNFRTDHLDAIQKRIAFNRGEAHRNAVRAAQRREESSRCMHCDNAGLVIVPHPQFYVEGVWSTPWPTCGVTCLCQKGEKASRDAAKREMPMLSLASYERSHPDWKEQMEERERLRTVLHQARSHTRFVDRTLDKTISDVLKRVG